MGLTVRTTRNRVKKDSYWKARGGYIFTRHLCKPVPMRPLDGDYGRHQGAGVWERGDIMGAV